MNKAETAVSEPAKAPVWDEAARAPASVVPAFIAAILQPFFISERQCFNNRSGDFIFSKYNNKN